MNGQRKRTIVRAVVLCVIAAGLLLASMWFIDRMQREQYKEARGTGTDAFMEAGSVTWEGERYKKTPGVTTILIAGIDREQDARQGVGTSRYRDGGQADFLLLLAVDRTHRQVHQLQIDRDAMTEVSVLGVYGQETGTRVMQICLAHSYGANGEENARYTVKAVRGLMNGLSIDDYYMLDYGAVPVLNDALGGVTVTVPDDMSSVNPLWTKGSVVTLAGDEAETFVRTRKTVGEGTNEERMGRQNAFMQSALAALREALAKRAEFGSQLITSLRPHVTTSLTDQRLLETIQGAADYEILPVEYLEGAYAIGESGFMEFYPGEGSAEQWIMRHLYTAA